MSGLGLVTKENHLLGVVRDYEQYFGLDKDADLEEEVGKPVWGALTYPIILCKPMI
jgi:hypothetical protein